MPDEFPTLEAVTLIGALVALVRTVELRTGLVELRRLGPELERALAAGRPERAAEVCSRARGAAFAGVANAIVEALGGGTSPDTMAAVVGRALGLARKSLDRGRARDFATTAVLLGAGAYAVRGALGVGETFYALLAIALGITLVGAIQRRATRRALDGLRASLSRAAAEGAKKRVAAHGEPPPSSPAMPA